MASESSDDAGVSVSLPADLEAWLDRKAADLDVDREAVVVQLLSSYRAAEEFGDDEVSAVLGDRDVESEVRDVIAERLPDIAEAVAERVDTGDVGEVEESLAAEIDRVEAEFTDKVQDVRERVVQVKREADDKADVDHTHPEFGELATLSTAVDDLESSLADIESRVYETAERVEDHEDRLDDFGDRVDEVEGATDRLEEVEERLRTVAWVVSDLREAERARSSGTEAIDRLKATAAELDVDRAVCGNCSRAVDIALLHEPTCPHCDATVSDVQLPGGLFGKPRLTVARQLEAGDETDRSNVPDAADRE
ncbi:hypothetical protein [Halosimplex salinum]|uniref:hypothetical protein n=1 Tax=Halosimplex salinum TaxID=1710538 RepID=UPI000F4620DF|nr:hypothetical protein [Halosimplex salinum]